MILLRKHDSNEELYVRGDSIMRIAGGSYHGGSYVTFADGQTLHALDPPDEIRRKAEADKP